MDGTTEPLIAVIGHPIAGNPSQFAVERALRSLDLDWRVLSFDVKPEDVAAALQGFAVTGISGVLIDPSVMAEASRWYAQATSEDSEGDDTEVNGELTIDTDLAREAVVPSESKMESDPELRENDASSPKARSDQESSQEPGDDRPTGADETSGDAEAVDDDETIQDDAIWIDCLHRDEQDGFLGSFEHRAWVKDIIERHPGEKRICIGAPIAGSPLGRTLWTEEDPIPLPPDPETIRSASLIVIADDEDDPPALLECEDWPEDDGSTLIIDLTEGHPEQAVMRQLGYRVVTELDRRIGTLQRSLKQWTGQECSTEVIHDAIEEYLGV